MSVIIIQLCISNTLPHVKCCIAKILLRARLIDCVLCGHMQKGGHSLPFARILEHVNAVRCGEKTGDAPLPSPLSPPKSGKAWEILSHAM